jgi:hypothetical protein
MKQISQQRDRNACSFDVVYAAPGDKDQAFQWLAKSYQDHAPEISQIKVDPILDSLHTDPRFADLVKRLGLQP